MDADEALVTVDVKHGLRRVLDAPDDDHGDLHRVAPLVVHLELFAVQVAGPQGYLELAVEGVRPEETVLAGCALVLTEQREDGRFVRLEREKTAERDE